MFDHQSPFVSQNQGWTLILQVGGIVDYDKVLKRNLCKDINKKPAILLVSKPSCQSCNPHKALYFFRQKVTVNPQSLFEGSQFRG